MKKIVTLLTSLFFILTVSAKADWGMGITGALHMFDGDGTETTRESGQVNNGSHSEDVAIPEIFVETFDDSNGFALGLSYIPTRALGPKTRTDTKTNKHNNENKQ